MNQDKANENLRKISELLKPEVFKSNLILSSIYIAYFENTKDYIIDQPRIFFSDTFTAEKGFIPNKSYKQKVLSLEPNNVLNASLNWVKNLNAISSSDSKNFGIIRRYRNKLAHELPKILLDDGLEMDEFIKNLSKLFEIRIKIEKYWYLNFEVELMNIENGENIGENDVVTGGEIIYKLFMDLLSEDEHKSNYYSQELKNHLKKIKITELC